MRREHVLDNISNIPFAEDLVFYAPLTEGDLTDHVNNLQGKVRTTAFITWDSSVGMYLIDSPQKNYLNGGIYWELPQPMMKPWTIYCRCNFITSSGNNYSGIAGLINTTTGSDYFLTGYRATLSSNPTPFEADLCMVVKTVDNNPSIFFYRDGVLKKTEHWTSTVGWNQVIVGTGSNGSTNTKMYVKDVRIYNRVLSVSEVAQL